MPRGSHDNHVSNFSTKLGPKKKSVGVGGTMSQVCVQEGVDLSSESGILLRKTAKLRKRRRRGPRERKRMKERGEERVKTRVN